MVTGICEWFHLLGLQAVTLWQLTQFTDVGMWFATLPVAALPLWHVEHTVAAVYRLWSGLEPSQVLVDLWQLSHTLWPLWMAVAGRLLRP